MLMFFASGVKRFSYMTSSTWVMGDPARLRSDSALSGEGSDVEFQDKGDVQTDERVCNVWTDQFSCVVPELQ